MNRKSAVLVDICKRLYGRMIPRHVHLTLDLRRVQNQIPRDGVRRSDEFVDVAPLIQRAVDLWLSRNESPQHLSLQSGTWDERRRVGRFSLVGKCSLLNPG